MRYFLELAYKGTEYCGWQRQPNALSVQQCVEESLAKLLKCTTMIVGAGRTDTGVHAAYYIAHFEADPIEEPEKFIYHLNCTLPHDIAARRLIPVAASAHARFDAVSREYRYYVRFHKSPFLDETSALLPYQLDLERMNRAAARLCEVTDFTSFCKLHSDNQTNICHVSECRWSIEGEQWVFTIRADRFLRNMVRAVVGTLIDVGRGKVSEERFETIITGRNRSLASSSAPAQGLFLTDIVYPSEVYSHDQR